MSLITEIKRDRETGTPGPWRAGASTFYPGLDGPLTARVYTDTPPNEIEVTGDSCLTDACRIARVPQLEAALLAAEDIARALEQMDKHGHTDGVWIAAKSALTAYRKAVGEDEG